MSYLIFRGVSTESLTGVKIAKMPDHKKASMRRTEYRIKGRDGVFSVDEGYDNFELTVTLVLIDATAATRQLVNAWADGTGKLVSSDDLTKAYKASVKEEIIWRRVPGNSGYYDTAKITFDCEPFMYEATDTVLQITETTPIVNPGSAEAYPLIKVEGSDTEAVAFDFCGEYLIIRGIDPNDPVFIDCENGYIYTQSGTAKSIQGNIPKIPMGSSGVYFNPEHPPTKITITPHWRWI